MTTELLDADAKSFVESFDFSDEQALINEFKGINEYERFALDDVGFVKWFKAEKQVKQGRQITTGYGFLVSAHGDVYFRLPACQKHEFDPETKGPKFVRQYRRVKTGQPVSFEVKESDRGLRTERFIFWEPSEFEKVSKQITYGDAFAHRLVKFTKRISLNGNHTIGVEETVLWEGDSLDQMRIEVPRTVEEFKVHKPIATEEGDEKVLTYQQVQYKDMFDSAGRHGWVTCLDPR